jgi:hypothetical protein
MSVYNGFTTRAQETTYNKTLYNIVFLLQLKILKDSRNDRTDNESDKDSFRNKWIRGFRKLFFKLRKLEDSKFLPPKFSYACNELASFYNLSEMSTTKSTLSKTSSNFSLTNCKLAHSPEKCFL